MRIEIRIGPAGPRRWHLLLADRIRMSPCRPRVELAVVPGDSALPAQVDALLRLEHLVLRRGRDALFDRVPGSAGGFQMAAGDASDVVIDCTGNPPEAGVKGGETHLRPLFAGLGSERALIAELLRGAMPEIAVEDVVTGSIAATGRPGGGDAGLLGALDAVLSRTVLLIDRVLRDRLVGVVAAAPVPAASPRSAMAERGAVAWAVRSLAMDCARAIYHLCVRAPHWHIGWRLHDGPGVVERCDLGGPRWTVLSGGAHRFLADPFPVTWDGRTVVFFEEYDYRVGRGTIAGIAFGESGPIGEIFPVLSEPFHLSYPFVMEWEGALYMIPEASLTGTVPLYRCVEFPTRWERVGSLLEGIEASDCTILRHAGLLWMMSSTRDGLGGYSDTLSIHHAESLTGTWTEHAQRPALIDAGLARPAGNVVRVAGGRLFRPIQDCRKGYGLGLVLAEIERLDRDHFEQTVRAAVVPGQHWGGRRLHTVNRAGRLEVIDGAGVTTRIPLPTRS